MTGMEQWLGGAAVVGILASLWGKIKILSWRVVNLFVVRARLGNHTGRAVAYYCWSEMRHTPFGEKNFDSVEDFVQPVDRYQFVGFETLGWDSLLFWKQWRPFLIGMGVHSFEGGGNSGAVTTITFIRGTFNLDNLIIKALDKYNETIRGSDAGNRYFVRRAYGTGPLRYGGAGKAFVKERGEAPEITKNTESSLNPDRRYLKWDKDEIGLPRGSNDPFGSLAFPANVLDEINRCRRWLASEKWYKNKDIPWRLGVLLYGPPGTGKTSFVKAIGKELNLPVISYDLASFSNPDFEAEWQKMMTHTPCIALLEDIDAVFNGRENRLGEEGGGLTFDCLLNCIGGIKDANGVLVFVTTNKPSCLDEALGKPDGDRGVSTRPGRIDLVIELGPLDEDCRHRIAQRILVDCPDKIDDLVEQGTGDSGAQFTERCSKVALEDYWNNKNVHVNGDLRYHSKTKKVDAGEWINSWSSEDGDNY